MTILVMLKIMIQLSQFVKCSREMNCKRFAFHRAAAR